jgi:hypothetical protein
VTTTATTPQPGDSVELGTVRYKIAATLSTDEGPMLRLDPVGGVRFVMASELRASGDGVWRPETEGEARESWGR